MTSDKDPHEKLMQEEQNDVDKLIRQLDDIAMSLDHSLSRAILQRERASSSCLPDTYADLTQANVNAQKLEEDQADNRTVRKELYSKRLLLEDRTNHETLNMRVGIHWFQDGGDTLVYYWAMPLCRHYLLDDSSIDFVSDTDDKGVKTKTSYHLLQKRDVVIRKDKVLNVEQLYPVPGEEWDEEGAAASSELSPEAQQRQKQIVTDEFLKTLLERRADKEFHNIVFSIQREQSAILQRPFQENLIVQGCAGSGKSMIMMHRLPIILYGNETYLPRKSIYIITPSEAYIQMASALRDELEIKDLNMGTIDDYYREMLSRYMVPADPGKPGKVPLTADQLSMAYSTDMWKYLEDNLRERTDRYLRKVIDLCTKNHLKAPTPGKSYAEKVQSFSLCLDRIASASHKSSKTAHSQSWHISAVQCLLNVQNDLYRYAHTSPDFLAWASRRPVVLDRAPITFRRLSEKELDKAIRDVMQWETERPAPAPASITQQLKNLFGTQTLVNDDSDTISSLKQYYSDLFQNLEKYVYQDALKKIHWDTESAGGAPSCAWYLYTLVMYLARGVNQRKRENLIMIDEAQNLAPQELDLLRLLNANACTFNLYGDVNQHIEHTKGFDRWEDLDDIPITFNRYDLKENYRNAEAITRYCNKAFHMNMLAISVPGRGVQDDHLTMEEALQAIRSRLHDVLPEGVSAIIVKDDIEAQWFMKNFQENAAALNDMTTKDPVVSYHQWNLLTTRQARGLEFSTVIVLTAHMTVHEKYIACTRALNDLCICDFTFDPNDLPAPKNKHTVKNAAQALGLAKDAPILQEEEAVRHTHKDSKLLRFLKAKNARVVDQRDSGGYLYVIGSRQDILPVIKEAVRTFHVSGQFITGVSLKGCHEAWYTKSDK